MKIKNSIGPSQTADLKGTALNLMNSTDLFLSANKRKIVEPSMVEKEGLLSQTEIQMLFLSKLIDMRMKYSDEQNERFQRYIEKNSYNGKLKLVNMGLK